MAEQRPQADSTCADNPEVHFDDAVDAASDLFPCGIGRVGRRKNCPEPKGGDDTGSEGEETTISAHEREVGCLGDE